MMNQHPARLFHLFLFLLSTLVLLWPACYNGFPLVTPDTGAYISSGIRLSVHPDRPIGYGLFILLSSMGISLWFVVIAQALLLGWLIRRLIRKVLGADANPVVYTLVLLLLCVGTTMSWYTAQLTPDIFTAALLLTVLLFFLERQDKKKSRTYGIVLFFLLATHNSHTVIVLLLCLLLLLYFKKQKIKDCFIAARNLFFIGVAMFVVQSSIYMIGGYGFGLSPVSSVFLVSRMAENGILDQYLGEQCPVEHYSLCDYQGRLGMRQWDFMWNNEFPHNKQGWVEMRPEYNRIVWGTLTTPKYLGLHILKSLEGTVKQIPQIYLNEGLVPEITGSNTDRNIALYFGHQLKEFRTSAQARALLQPTAGQNNLLIVLFAVATSAAVLWLGRKKRTADKDATDWPLLFGITLLFQVLNAWTTATFSTVVARFQARVFWVLPLLCFLFILKQYFSKNTKSDPLEPHTA